MPDSTVEYILKDDPKHLLFTMARYNFVAKMFAGYAKVLEVGCGNGFGSAIVRQSVNNLTAVDLPEFDITKNQAIGYDGVYCLDVFEHIPENLEKDALRNLSASAPVCIIGTPSLESQIYASKLSKIGHVNCKTSEELKSLCESHWSHVFMFTMQDAVLGTSYPQMAHYLIAMCVDG